MRGTCGGAGISETITWARPGSSSTTRLRQDLAQGDRYRLSVDSGRCLGGQERDHGCDFPRFDRAPRKVGTRSFLPHLLRRDPATRAAEVTSSLLGLCRAGRPMRRADGAHRLRDPAALWNSVWDRSDVSSRAFAVRACSSACAAWSPTAICAAVMPRSALSPHSSSRRRLSGRGLIPSPSPMMPCSLAASWRTRPDRSRARCAPGRGRPGHAPDARRAARRQRQRAARPTGSGTSARACRRSRTAGIIGTKPQAE